MPSQKLRPVQKSAPGLVVDSDLQFKNSAVPDQTPRPSNANSNQLRYILDSVLTFCMGPAGLLYCLDDETQRR